MLYDILAKIVLKVLWLTLKSVLDNTLIALSEMLVFADDNINVTQNMKFGYRNIENILGKGENALFLGAIKNNFKQ